MIIIGEQITPDAIGTEVGVQSDLRRGIPKPREAKSQETQTAHGGAPDHNKNVKLQMNEKVRSEN